MQLTRIQELCTVAGAALLIGAGAMWVMSSKQSEPAKTTAVAPVAARQGRPLSDEDQATLDRLSRKVLGSDDACEQSGGHLMNNVCKPGRIDPRCPPLVGELQYGQEDVFVTQLGRCVIVDNRR